MHFFHHFTTSNLWPDSLFYIFIEAVTMSQLVSISKNLRYLRIKSQIRGLKKTKRIRRNLVWRKNLKIFHCIKNTDPRVHPNMWFNYIHHFFFLSFYFYLFYFKSFNILRTVLKIRVIKLQLSFFFFWRIRKVLCYLVISASSSAAY